jgi:diacylglycerol kinase (ATP)
LNIVKLSLNMAEKKSDKWVFIVNPTAGNNYGKTMLPELKKRIEEFKIDGKILLTEYPGHAVQLSEQAYKEGAGYIIAVGGDGTVNEVARPLIGKSDIITGIVPAGTGNDFNQIPGFPDRFSDTDWKVFFKKNIIAQDVGLVNGIIFLNGLGLGFDAEVAAQNYTEGGKVKKGGGDKYIWHIVKTLLFFREKRMIVNSNGNKHETDCFINTVSIGRRFAGSFFLTPKAIANDGLLDVCSIKKLNLFHRFRLLLKVPKGTHITDMRVSYYQTPSINLQFPKEVPFHVDGELSFAKEFSIRILPEALNIIYNPDGNHYFKRI